MATKSVLCRYHVYGYCNLGSQCAFSHDKSSEPSQICRYYLKGKCPFEKKCRYDHVKPSSNLNSSPHNCITKNNFESNCCNKYQNKEATSSQILHNSDVLDTLPSTSGYTLKQDTLDTKTNHIGNIISCPHNQTHCCQNADSSLPYHSYQSLNILSLDNVTDDDDPGDKDQILPPTNLLPNKGSSNHNQDGNKKDTFATTNSNVKYLNLKPLFFQTTAPPTALHECIHKTTVVASQNYNMPSDLKPVLGYRPPSLLNLFTTLAEPKSCSSIASSTDPLTPASSNVSATIKKHVFNVGAKEFFPLQPKSYSEALAQNMEPMCELFQPEDTRPLCPFLTDGECWYGEQCVYLHGEVCDVCDKNVLHPFDTKQRQSHREQCMREIQMEMEFSFAVQRSEEKTCGICLDNVLDKGNNDTLDGRDSPLSSSSPMTSAVTNDKRFGILPNCIHCYCLPCIMNWRKTKNETLDNNIIRSCPECRVQSYFIIPSKIWVEDKAEKSKMIEEYKKSLSDKPCKYFRKGAGECPLNDICFYKHDYPDGTLALRHTGGGRRRFNPNGRRQPLFIRNRGATGRHDPVYSTERLLWDFFAARFNSLEFLNESFDLISLGTDEDDDEENMDGLLDYHLFQDLSLTAESPVTGAGPNSRNERQQLGPRSSASITPRTASSSSSNGPPGPRANGSSPRIQPVRPRRRRRSFTFYGRRHWEPSLQ